MRDIDYHENAFEIEVQQYLFVSLQQRDATKNLQELSTKLDLDYVETLIREKFMFGKEGETLYIIKKNDN